MVLAKTKLEMLRVLEVSAVLPRNLEEADQKLTTLRHDMRACNYIFCRTLAHVRDENLWKTGHRSKEAWWRATFRDASVNTMYRALWFADNVPLDVALAYDATKIDLGIRLLRRREGKDVLVTLEKLTALKISAHADSGGTKTIPFKDATAEEIALEALEEHHKTLPPVTPTHERQTARLQKRLGEDVEVRTQHVGQKLYAVVTMPIEHLSAFEKQLK